MKFHKTSLHIHVVYVVWGTEVVSVVVCTRLTFVFYAHKGTDYQIVQNITQ
jgi:hypothetical protein